MRRITTLGSTIFLLLSAACGQADQTGRSADSSDPRDEEFRHRAASVASAWRDSSAYQAWDKGYVPLQDATVLPADPGFDDGTKQAFLAGWYRTEVRLPDDQPPDGVIRFQDGTLEVPLISAAEAYGQIALADPPACPRERPTQPTPASPDDPDSPVSSPAMACGVLTVTDVTLGTATVRTSRGDAEVPAWLFTIDELAGPIARLAVDASAVTPVPEFPVPDGDSSWLVPAQDLTVVDDRKVTFRLGVGACDSDIQPLVFESNDAVVVAGTSRPSEEPCTMQLVLEPVTVVLAAPLGARPVLDAVTGQPLQLRITG